MLVKLSGDPEAAQDESQQSRSSFLYPDLTVEMHADLLWVLNTSSSLTLNKLKMGEIAGCGVSHL